MNAERIPVIVGVGEALDRPGDLSKALEPLALMEAALREADADAGGGFLARIGSLDVINQLSWRYADAAGQLCARLGIAPARAVYGPVGGESPVRYLHEAAVRIARGEAEVCAVVGAEAQWSVNKARSAGVDLPWTPKPPADGRGPRIEVHPLALKLGVFLPVSVYPFYENAAARHWGQTPRQALAESGALWSAYAAVAARQPNAWIKTAFTPEQITTPRPDNRPIAWPYTKLMVANMQVNQGAAVIVTSLAAARAAGIADERLVFVWGGAAAREPGDYLQRDHYHGSVAQDAVLETVSGMAGGFDALELYSCFPCVPKMARRTLGLPAPFEGGVTPTVTGGLTFFGAPMNDYMTHAAVAMTRRLREGGTGLLYGQGEFVTKHHGLVLADRPAPEGGRPLEEISVQAAADARRGAVPAFVEAATGSAVLETATVLYDRDGAPTHGVAIVRTGDGARALARVPAADTDTLAALTDPDAFAIGRTGTLTAGDDGVVDWRL
ncbi:acetyl-CoA acetyltransferase [Caulobacter sp. UNC358MFTsu5.1]|uniref:acetyl-CoA acetyltransferase n=1 Tax=Caulobacter sp. UNC358MFTsu5.1 TaxID=1449049 RepID=UPI0004A754B5|nr:acetyl-CoA acetyltransferase [Caulobacter sp. UNC358MFTsu5.1]